MSGVRGLGSASRYTMRQGVGDLCSRNEMRSSYRLTATAHLHAPVLVALALWSGDWMTVPAHLFNAVRPRSVSFKWAVVVFPAHNYICG
jgi:hypothetical protein